MMKQSLKSSFRLVVLSLLLMMTQGASAQVSAPKETPLLEFVMQLRVTLGEVYTVGDTPHGRCVVIPMAPSRGRSRSRASCSTSGW